MSNEIETVRIECGKLTEAKIQMLLRAQHRAEELTEQLHEVQSVYRALIGMAMPEGATGFNRDTMTFYREVPAEWVNEDGVVEDPDVVPLHSAPAEPTESS